MSDQDQPGAQFPPPPPTDGGTWPPPPPPPSQHQWPGPSGPYGAPPYGYAGPTSTNGLAIASMVLGILWLWWIGSLLAVIFGHVALGQINQSHGQQSGKGMAIAGLVLGYLGVAMFVFVFVVIQVLGESASTTFSSTGEQIN